MLSPRPRSQIHKRFPSHHPVSNRTRQHAHSHPLTGLPPFLYKNMSTPFSTPSSSQPPSTYAIAFSSALLGLLSGYFLSTALSLNLFSSFSSPSSTKSSSEKPKSAKKESWPNSYNVTLHPDTSDEDLMRSLQPKPASLAREELDAEPSTPNSSESEKEAEQETTTSSSTSSSANHNHHNQALSTFPSHKHSTYKLVIVISTDLSLSPAKTAAQASLATLQNYPILATPPPQQSRRKFFSPANPSPTWDPAPNPVLERWEAQGQAKIVVGVKGG